MSKIINNLQSQKILENQFSLFFFNQKILKKLNLLPKIFFCLYIRNTRFDESSLVQPNPQERKFEKSGKK